MIPITKSVFGVEELEAVKRPLISGWITQGPEVAAFELEFADFVGSNFACAVSSCTSAMHLALLAVGVGPGDEVVTVSHSFIATANSVSLCGATPVFSDITLSTFNMSPESLKRSITPNTKAVLCVHQMGLPCDLSSILEIAASKNLPVIEDAACAIGSEIHWRDEWQKIGRPHGKVACFSFHPRKLMTTGDGGMITTNDETIDTYVRRARHHGMTVSDTERHAADNVVIEAYPTRGFNYRLTDIQAAVGREQLKRVPEIVPERRRLADRYAEILNKIEGLVIPYEPEGMHSNWQSYCVRLPPSCDQLAVLQKLLVGGISARRGIMSSHLEEAYFDDVQLLELEASTYATRTSVLLPLFPGMTETQQDQVARVLKEACKCA